MNCIRPEHFKVVVDCMSVEILLNLSSVHFFEIRCCFLCETCRLLIVSTCHAFGL